jgi:hypothetical protein
VQDQVVEGQVGFRKRGEIVDFVSCPHGGHALIERFNVRISNPAGSKLAGSCLQHPAQFDELHGGVSLVFPFGGASGIPAGELVKPRP